MAVKDDLLAYLLDHPGHYYPGPDLASHFNVSRNAIWKAIKQLETDGYDILRHPKNGYALTGLNQAIDVNQISHGLQEVWPELAVHYNASVTSTNDLGRKHATDFPNQPAVFIANEQTAGRGRRGRNFYSSLTKGLYFSLVITPPKNLNNDLVVAFTIATATAYAESLQTYLPENIAIKWVNDIFYQGKKVVGILSEGTFDLESQSISHLVVGIGTNLAGDFQTESPENEQVAGTLFGKALPQDFNPNDLLVTFLSKFKSYYDNMENLAFLDFYRSHLLGLNQWVSYETNGVVAEGKILGVTDTGHLQVEDGSGQIHQLVSGEVHFSSQQFANLYKTNN